MNVYMLLTIITTISIIELVLFSLRIVDLCAQLKRADKIRIELCRELRRQGHISVYDYEFQALKNKTGGENAK
jgi:hypothetical protein